jgi:transcriptional regulator with XRE-family HTH domain
MEEASQLGLRLKQLREVRGQSIRSMAVAAGVSASFVSQLERGYTNASIASLRKIAGALGVPVADLLDPNPTHTQGVLRADKRPSTPLSSGSQKFVISQPPVKNVEIYVGQFEPGGATGNDPYVHGNAQEFLIVLSGTIVLELGDKSYAMAKDDSIEYLSSVPHRVSNSGDSLAEVMFITSPPTTKSSPVPRDQSAQHTSHTVNNHEGEA